MKKCNFIAFAAILMFASCAQEFELLENKNVEQDELTPSGVIVDGKLVPYLTFTDWDLLNVGDTIHISEIEFDDSQMPMQTRNASTTNDALFQLVDFPINIVVRESNTGARFLTHQGLHNQIVLRNHDANNSVFQIFYLKNYRNCEHRLRIETVVPSIGLVSGRPQARLERMLVSGGVLNNTTFILTVFSLSNNAVVSGFRWWILPSQRDFGDSNGAYVFFNADLPDICLIEGLRGAMCLQAENTNIRFGSYAGRGNQEFEIRPIEEFDMISLEIFTDNTSSVVRIPDFVEVWTYNNNTDVDLNMTTSFSRRVAHTSNFTRSHGVSLSIGTTVSVRAPLLVNGQVSTTANTDMRWTYGRTEQVEDTRTYSFPLTIRSRTKVTATISIARYEMNLRYRAVFRGRTTGRIFTEVGDWQGVDFTQGRVDAQVTDAFGNTETVTFDGIPTTRVVLPRPRPNINIRPLPPDDLRPITLPPGGLEPIIVGPPIDTPPIFQPFP